MSEETKPVARVHYPTTGGNVGVHWVAVSVDPTCSPPLLPPGTLLYAAPLLARCNEIERLREERSMRIAAGEAFDRAQTTNRTLAEECDRLRARIAELEAALAAELETPAYHSGGASGIDFGGGDIKVYLTTTVGATTPPLTGPEEP